MELQSTMPSVVHNEQQSDLKGSSSRNSIKWDKEISFEEAYRTLEAKFYSFKKVIGSKHYILRNMKCLLCRGRGANTEKVSSWKVSIPLSYSKSDGE